MSGSLFVFNDWNDFGLGSAFLRKSNTGDLTVDTTKIQPEHEGWWRLSFEAQAYDFSYQLTIENKYVILEVRYIGLEASVSSNLPMLSTNFGGVVLENKPEMMSSDNTVDVFVSDVTPGGQVSIGFSESVGNSGPGLDGMSQTAVRKLGVEVIIYEEGDYYNAAVYEVFDAINIEVASS